MMRIATGEAEETYVDAAKRKAGQAGGKARAEAVSTERRARSPGWGRGPLGLDHLHAPIHSKRKCVVRGLRTRDRLTAVQGMVLPPATPLGSRQRRGRGKEA